MMYRLHYPQGWLLYANPEISKGLVLSGDVMSFELSAEQSYGGHAFRVTCEVPVAELRQGAPLEMMMWEALQSWPDEKAGRRWPPEMEALLELARRYPEEYEKLHEGLAVFRALGG